MSNKVEQLLEVFQGNAYPAMYEDLATHLGVTADSIRKLALGWAPVVQFKDKKNFSGWWIIPERDSAANVIGLGLRSQNDAKVMYPGTHHGLIYEVNPDHEHGERGYSAGPHNWVRTMDAGVACPVCNKPDGCLLSADNPADPKAVVCIRTESPRRLKFGWLHIRKPDGNLSGKSALADNGGPVVIVEGFSDTAAALGLGFNAVGRPSNLAKLDELGDLIRGRSEVWIIGENDKKPDGRWPGKEGMVATFVALSGMVHTLKMFLPPEHVKDLRAWIVKYGLTRSQLEAHAIKYGQTELDGATLRDDSPTTFAKSWLDQVYKMDARYRLRHADENWYEYQGGKYRAQDDEDLRASIYIWSKGKLVTTEGAKGPLVRPLKCTLSTVNNVMDAALGLSRIHKYTPIPGWINGVTGQDAVNLIPFENGLLDVERYLAGDPDYLLEGTPDYFTFFSIPHVFDPTAKCPRWERFLRETLGDDPGKIRLLREWFGYNLVPDTRYHKMMVLAGVPRGGKGTICHMLGRMLGTDQIVATELEDLTETFEFESWQNALAAIDDEAFLSSAKDGMQALGVLKGLTGDGFQSVKRKHKEKLSLRLKTRLTIAVNELPELPDFMGAMLPRLNLIDFRVSFAKRENYNLWSELETESAAICVWALEGLRRLRQQGKFTEPESSRAVLERWSVATNPLSQFVRECCEADPKGEAQKDALFRSWSAWSLERRIRPMTMTQFFERIKGSTGYPIVENCYMRGVHKINVYKGMRLQDWAARQFLGKPPVV